MTNKELKLMVMEIFMALESNGKESSWKKREK